MSGRQPASEGSTLRETFLFAQWAMQLPEPPTKHQVMDFLQCRGLKASRWRRTWLATLPVKPISPADGNRPGNPDTQSEKPQ